jgi:hypothetical protein
VTLSEKLEQARRERLIAAGRLPEPEPEPVRSPEPPRPSLFEPITIEVKPQPGQLVATAGMVDLVDYRPDTMCPNCHAPGVVDLVDLVGHLRHCSCRSCGAMWQVRDEIGHAVDLSEAEGAGADR